MKKWIALTLALVLVLSLCATAFAAKPAVKLTSSKNIIVKRGKTLKMAYKLNAGSYNQITREGFTYYMARFSSYLVKGINGGNVYLEYSNNFSGKKTLTLKKTVSKKMPVGQYIHVYGTAYRNDISGKWYTNSIKTSKVTITK